MSPEPDFFERLCQQKVLPILRLEDPEQARQLSHCLIDSQFSILEITLTTPGALEVIQELSSVYPDIGAGTVCTPNQAAEALAAGASFLVSPGWSLEIAELARSENVPYFPGVWTGTEIMTALSHGFTDLKLFPAHSLGPDYVKHLQGPFPEARFLVTGGIPVDAVGSYLAAGARVVGQGTRLVNKADLQAGRWEAIRTTLRTRYAALQELP